MAAGAPVKSSTNHVDLNEKFNMIHHSLRLAFPPSLHRTYEVEAEPLSNSYAVSLIFEPSEERAVWSLQ